MEQIEDDRAQLDSDKKFIEMTEKVMVRNFQQSIVLNVGGQRFRTSLDTLLSDPRSCFAATFGGRVPPTPQADGSYFIDRDGTHFRHILNYLRTHELILPRKITKDPALMKEFKREAEYYQIEGITKDEVFNR
eukprot:TRINITY_DN26_c0_g1_i2.p2 TRINITY_DN26_c0_g1~~TRINITY_DN26_c0_g1_i2.p2  ORF type:complete len:133 (-),score=39.87 TRINITY_DN26_c0_g1_i2:141-539(-)